MQITIGDLVVAPSALLAPMEGVTDVVFRRLIRRIGGCGMTATEFVPAAALSGEHRRAMRMVEIDPDERPVAIQIYGRDPGVMADGARWAREHGADVVDVNFGCPSKKVCAHSGGSSLLKEPELARRIVAAVRAAVDGPFTVKMRAGWDPEHRNAPEIAKMCEDEGVDAVTVHWRTRADGYGGERELDTIAKVVCGLSIPVIANGDIVDAASAVDTLTRTGAAGVMIGRGAVRNPWVFREIEAALNGLPEPKIGLDDREALLLDTFAALEQGFASERAGLGRIKKLARYFGDGLPGGDELRAAIWHSETIAVARSHTIAWFERAREDRCAA